MNIFVVSENGSILIERVEFPIFTTFPLFHPKMLCSGVDKNSRSFCFKNRKTNLAQIIAKGYYFQIRGGPLVSP